MSARANLMRLIALAGVAFGVAAVVVARRHPDLSLAGDATWASIAQLAAGWGLVAAGLAHWSRRPRSRCGALLASAGLAWFIVEASNPEVGSALVFSAGLVLFAACPPLIAHAVLVHSDGRLRTRGETTMVVLGYVAAVGVLGLLGAALYDPAAHGCLECPANLVELGGSRHAPRSISRAGLWLVFGWGVVFVALLAWRLVRGGAASRRFGAPVLATAAVYVGLVAADAGHGIGRAFESNDPTDRALWVGQALALVALAVGVTWERIRSLRMRAQLACLVAELDRPPAGGVRDALARALGEPQLALAYASSASGWLDADGRAVALPSTATKLGPEDAPVAAIVHPPDALQGAEAVAEIARAARPALEHERLQAEMRAQLAELRASRTRIVAAADGERRRLERDLHDGAQQRIVALALDLRLARRHITRQAPGLDAELGAAEDDLRLAVSELRDVARGIHPPMLEDAGLAAALHALAEEEPRLVLGDLPGERMSTTTESAAYHVITETLRRVPTERVSVHAHVAKPTLVLVVDPEAGLPDLMLDADDRVGAHGGRLVREDSGVLRVELPCE